MRPRQLLALTAVLSFGYSCAVLEQASREPATRPSRDSLSLLGAPVESAAPARGAANAYMSAPAAKPVDARVALATSALSALEAHVTQRSHPDGLRLAFQAYYNYRAANPDQVRKPYLYYVDYGLDNRTARGYVFDMDRLELVDGPFTVAHGRGSSKSRDGIPTRFTNTNGSASTSLGLYLTQETYGFRGTAGGRKYRSIGLRMKGLSGRFNSAARSRGVVIHGAPYVTPTQAGRSEGCPAMEESRAQRLIPMIAGGSLVFLFSPNDSSWMGGDPWTSVLGRVAAS